MFDTPVLTSRLVTATGPTDSWGELPNTAYMNTGTSAPAHAAGGMARYHFVPRAWVLAAQGSLPRRKRIEQGRRLASAAAMGGGRASASAHLSCACPGHSLPAAAQRRILHRQAVPARCMCLHLPRGLLPIADRHSKPTAQHSKPEACTTPQANVRTGCRSWSPALLGQQFHSLAGSWPTISTLHKKPQQHARANAAATAAASPCRHRASQR